MSRKKTKTPVKGKTEKEKNPAPVKQEPKKVQIEFVIKQQGDKFALTGNGKHFSEGQTIDELKERAGKIAEMTESTFSISVPELPKMEEKKEKVYDMIGINGKHEQLDTFKSLCKKNRWKIGEVLLKMITQFNEQNK